MAEDPKTVFIRSSLIRTADNNYLLARNAFLNGIVLDGFWMAAHAVEKYLKASLLLNGRDTRFFHHELSDLWKAHAELVGDLMPNHFVEPQRSDPDQQQEWRKQTIGEFLALLDRFGSPDNRYQLVGYLYDNLVLQKIDQLVFFIRRTCRPLNVKDERFNERAEWRLSERLPLEECVANPKHRLRPFFFEANPFWVSVLTGKPASTQLRKLTSFQPGSLQLAIAAARQLGPGRDREATIDLLQWLLEHVRLTKENQKKVQRALKRLSDAGEGAARKEDTQSTL